MHVGAYVRAPWISNIFPGVTAPDPLSHGEGRSMDRGDAQGNSSIIYEFAGNAGQPTPFFVGSPTPMTFY